MAMFGGLAYTLDMSNKKIELAICLLLFLLQNNVVAKNILGGYVSIKRIDIQSSIYRICLKLHIDERQGSFSLPECNVKIFKKSDGSEVQSFMLQKSDSRKAVYDQEVCFGIVEHNTVFVDYGTEVALDPARYSDSQGYYLEWVDCCREGNIVNIKDPESYNTTLRTFFLPVVASGTRVINSTPSIGDLNELFICRKQYFEYQIRAFDPEGDELKFSLASPMGYHSSSNSHLQWAQGFEVNQAIPGNPSLKIDANTGLLSVSPETNGLFVFAVCVEEYRNGHRIGASFREYMLYVLECPSTQRVDRDVYVDGHPTSEKIVCDRKMLTIRAKSNPECQYQWTRNGKSINGATSDSLQVFEAGEYAFTVSQSGNCPKTIESHKVIVSFSQSLFNLKKSYPSAPCEIGQKTIVYALKDKKYSYKWYRNSSLISNTADSLVTSEPGKYWVVLESSTGCDMFSDTIAIENNPIAVIELRSNKQTTICSGDSVLLETTPKAGYLYSWFKNDIQISGDVFSKSVKEQGEYKVTVRDPAGCVGESNVISVKLTDNIEVSMGQILPICGNNHTPITLVGSPGDGIFQGTGVVNNTFYPDRAGVGFHELTYSISPGGSCPDMTVKQVIEISDWPRFDLLKEICVDQGTGATIGVRESMGLKYSWKPEEGLSDPESPLPIVNVTQDIVYTVTAIDTNGCQASKSIQVRICNNVLIPDAFTPNQDGINDTWELKGIDRYPDAEVNIFNRWGNLIFRSNGYDKPFDGTLCTTDIYYYKIKLDNVLPIKTGALMLIR
jgi:gliding motility-associated-like protein